MAKRELRCGFTTGACAAAAAKGAALLLRDGAAATAEIALPAGFSAEFVLHGQGLDDGAARCFVIKDAGDDPDVTHGIELHARLQQTAGNNLEIIAGTGIGRVTKPGLAVAVGMPAINPVPRQMIEQAIAEVFPAATGLQLTLSIPDGEQRAAKTLNARLGILGGLSLLGTTGVVRPLSHRAWTDTLEVAIDVALAAGASPVVLSTGRTSELAAQQHFSLPDEAFVMMGDYIGYTLEACHRKGVPKLALSAQFAKLLKIACGHPQTHVRHSQLDLTQLLKWAKEIGLDAVECQQLELANTARQVFTECSADSPLIERVGREALSVCQEQLPGADVSILLINYHGQVANLFTSP
jgi:cobalt-precorrin-5B (C1)-methyltransferase